MFWLIFLIILLAFMMLDYKFHITREYEAADIVDIVVVGVCVIALLISRLL